MTWTSESVTTKDGLRLNVRVFAPVSSPRGTILVIHGGGDHGGRYLHVAERLGERGWRCILPDHRGHGVSEGTRWDVDRIDTYLRDLQTVLDHFRQPKSDTVLLGHSFGGMLAARWAEFSPAPQAEVLTSPLFELAVNVPAWKRLLGNVLVWIAPQTRFRSGLDPKNMMLDPARLAERRADPYLQKYLTARWFFAMQAGMQVTRRDAKKVQCPLLVLQGADDRTVVPGASREWIERTSSTRRDYHEFPGHVHELLNEADWATTTDLIADWLETL
ncbi:MAG TPA: alpha/beta hydrolase [Planctomycetaceae bacterium]|jgi:alpha-beta hydrolase superfamily lysophospholipase|nr:alpha/beta hydrolase [Planctomycetaceae bacterium]